MQDHQPNAVPNAVPVVTISDHRAVTTSKAVADYFGKQHRDVLRAIDALCANLPEKAMRNFAQG